MAFRMRKLTMNGSVCYNLIELCTLLINTTFYIGQQSYFIINIVFIFLLASFFWLIKETNKTTTLVTHLFYNIFLYCLTHLAIAITFLIWQVYSFMEDFTQMNVFCLDIYVPFFAQLIANQVCELISDTCNCYETSDMPCLSSSILILFVRNYLDSMMSPPRYIAECGK